MSINFTSDIDGATSGSGITKITVGDKTINLAEVVSGGGNGASGTFTIDNTTTKSVTVNTGLDDVHFIAMLISPDATMTSGTRIWGIAIADFDNDYWWYSVSNAGGTALITCMFGKVLTDESHRFSKAGGDVTFSSPNAVNNSIYQWYAL